MFVYTHCYSGEGGNNAPADLAARFSTDAGLNWTRKDIQVLENEGGIHVMAGSVSPLRLANGGMALTSQPFPLHLIQASYRPADFADLSNFENPSAYRLESFSCAVGENVLP